MPVEQADNNTPAIHTEHSKKESAGDDDDQFEDAFSHIQSIKQQDSPTPVSMGRKSPSSVFQSCRQSVAEGNDDFKSCHQEPSSPAAAHQSFRFNQ